MIEASMTYLWQTPNDVDTKVLCASTPASFFRTQSDFVLAWANEVKANKQASSTARLRLTLRRPVVSHNGHKSAGFSLNHNLSGSCIGTRFSSLDASSAKTVFNHYADTGISTPVSAFFISRNTSLPQVSA